MVKKILFLRVSFVPRMKRPLLFFFLFTAAGVAVAQNVAINTSGSAADVSAMLDIVASDKGMLLPRVSLSSNTDAATISGTEANSLIVFNTNGSMTNGNGKGYYYWDLPTLKWIYLAGASNGPGTTGQVLTSQGGGNNPQWTSPSFTSGGGGPTGCAACITTISTTEWANVDWVTCRNNCRTLAEGGYSDWRLPTFDEAVYYLNGTFDPPDGTWRPDYVWTCTPSTSLYSTTASVAMENFYVLIREDSGQWKSVSYVSNAEDCRCVR